MIDVHILTTSRLPSDWINQSIASVKSAMALSTVPVSLYFSPEAPGDFWKARWDGYKLGNSEWVTYIDLDDWVDPSLFQVVAPHLLEDVDTLQTKGYDLHVKYGKMYPTDRGVRFHRRKLVEEADYKCTHVCCPSCHMFYTSNNKKTIEDRLATFRVGYDSLAQQWRRKNAVV